MQCDLQVHSSDLRKLLSNILNSFKPYQVKMETINSKEKKGSSMLVRGVEWKALDFKLSPTIVETLDLSGAQSQIPPKVLLINNICSHFKCTI